MSPQNAAPRILMRRLREIMAKPGDPQERLDIIVRQIALIMVAEVCSLYLRRHDGSLELFATEGLKPEAVHNTHLAKGEGLVGLIAEGAEMINIHEAQDHPAFAYRPETGEEIYHSFLGMPILRGGRTLGVITVQNKARKVYSEEEVEALETTAMLVAELITSGELDEGVGDIADRAQPRHFSGVGIGAGIALGTVVLHEPRVMIHEFLSEDQEIETSRLMLGIDKLRKSVDSMLAKAELQRAGEHREVLEAYRLFAHDQGWVNKLLQAIDSGLTAEAAVERVQNDMRARMLPRKDRFWAERMNDLEDLSNRLIRILVGSSETAAQTSLPDNTILVARTMGAAELLDYEQDKLRGLVLEDSGASSHVAIVARALGIAAIGDVKGVVNRADTGNDIIVDAVNGEVFVRPERDVIDAYSDKVRFQAAKQRQFAKLRNKPALSLDGVSVSLKMNAGLLVDLPHMVQSGADGIGLYRTELQFMISAKFPRIDEQQEIYKAVLDAAGRQQVVFRTLDVGGDKILPYMRMTGEQNPALGWRAVRMTLDRPGLFRSQVRALLRASGGRALSIMLPMVSDLSELEGAKKLIAKELELLSVHGRAPPSALKIGIMIEVPAIIWQLEDILPLVDFVSIGSNDLMQFLFAADRTNALVSQRYDSLHPVFLKVVNDIISKAKAHDVPVTLCGEMAGNPLESMALLGLGLRSISMSPASIGPVKAMIHSLDIGKLTGFMNELLCSSSRSLRPEIEAFARKNQVIIDPFQPVPAQQH